METRMSETAVSVPAGNGRSLSPSKPRGDCGSPKLKLSFPVPVPGLSLTKEQQDSPANSGHAKGPPSKDGR